MYWTVVNGEVMAFHAREARGGQGDCRDMVREEKGEALSDECRKKEVKVEVGSDPTRMMKDGR